VAAPPTDSDKPVGYATESVTALSDIEQSRARSAEVLPCPTCAPPGCLSAGKADINLCRTSSDMLRFFSMDFLFKRRVGLNVAMAGLGMNEESEEFDGDCRGP
jgi:hypothetical protein